MPIDTNNSAKYDQLELVDYQRIETQPYIYYKDIIEPELKNFKNLETPLLMKKLPQLQFDKFYANLIHLYELKQNIAYLVKMTMIDGYSNSQPINSPTTTKLHRREEFFPRLIELFAKFQDTIPKPILNGNNYVQKIKKAYQDIPYKAKTGENILYVTEVSDEFNIYLEFENDQLFAKDTTELRKARKAICDHLKNRVQDDQVQTMIVIVGLIQCLINLQIKILKYQKKTQIQYIPTEYLKKLYQGELISKREYKKYYQKEVPFYAKKNHSKHRLGFGWFHRWLRF